MTTQRAEVICDSIGDYSPRLTTFKLRYHKFIHGELMTHRMLSRNASSSRAVPVAKLIAEVRDDATRAAPVWWGAEQKGMQSGDELSEATRWTLNDEKISERDAAKMEWQTTAIVASQHAQNLHDMGVHKSIVNRILEPYSHINVVATGVEDAWLNFFGLRLDKAAQPEMRALAELMWAAWNESRPKKLESGRWHLPFVRGDMALLDDILPPGNGLTPHDQFVRISVARCARVSYESFETGKRSTVEEDLKLYERLMGSQPLHASPAEHQATPDGISDFKVEIFVPTPEDMDQRKIRGDIHATWTNSEQHGNLPGWRQYRKMLDGERVAPLPEGYVYKGVK